MKSTFARSSTACPKPRQLPALVFTLAALGALVGASAPARAEGIFRDPTGLSFFYPDGWTVRQEASRVELLPPDRLAGAELYVIGAENVAGRGLRGSDDARIIFLLEKRVGRHAHKLTRDQRVRVVPAGVDQGMLAGQAAVVNWKGKDAQGQEQAARALAGVIGDFAVFLLALGQPAQIEKRSSEIGRIFRTIRHSGSGAPAVSAETRTSPGGAVAEGAAPAGWVGGEAWGFKFRPPEGWVARSSEQGAILGHQAVAGTIIVRPIAPAKRKRLRALLRAGVSEGDAKLELAGRVRALKKRAFYGDYQGTALGQPLKVRIIASCAPWGGFGAAVFALATPDKFGPDLTEVAEEIVQKLSYLKPKVTRLMRHFAGLWKTTAEPTEKQIHLGPSGFHYSEHETGFHGRFYDKHGDWVGRWGLTRSQRPAGRWTVRGSRRRGEILIRLPDGSQQTHAYEVHTERGKPRWRKYRIDGQLYLKARK